MKKVSSNDRPLLLDVNALLALGWSNHQFHRVLVERLEQRPLPRWATCALTHLGFVRLSCNPSAVGAAQQPAAAASLLGRLCADARHVLFEQLPAVTDLAGHFDRIIGHQQVVDAYLVALARHHGATLLTFDRRLTAAAASTDLVEVLP